jgi:hypothetical protein
METRVPLRFAYLSQGKLFLKSGDAPELLYESPFARGIRDRAMELHRRHSWKSGGGSGDRMIPRAALWGANAGDPSLVRIDFNSIAPQGVTPGFIYSIISREISGVLALQEESGSELRLLHTADYRVTHVASQPDTGRIAMSMQHPGGASLAVMEPDGRSLLEITQGESYDESPAWVPGSQNKLVFQSAGVAHNEAGHIVGMAPYSIQTLALDDSQLATLLESPEHDYLAPRLSRNDTLYFIRRPYKMNRQPRNLLRGLEDILLFPYRLLYAIFQFLNFFSARYTGRPLSQSGPLLQKQADQRQMILWGNVVEAQKGIAGDPKDGPSLVPASWELCRKLPGHDIEVLAKSVLSFDLDCDGGVLYSNGSTIFHLTSNGEKTKLHKAAFIEKVVALSPSTRISHPATLNATDANS